MRLKELRKIIETRTARNWVLVGGSFGDATVLVPQPKGTVFARMSEDNAHFTVMLEQHADALLELAETVEHFLRGPVVECKLPSWHPLEIALLKVEAVK